MSRRARTAQRKATQAGRRATLTTRPAEATGEGVFTVGKHMRAPAHLDLPPADLYPGDRSFDPDSVNDWLQHRLGLADDELHHAQRTWWPGITVSAAVKVVYHCPTCGGELQDGPGAMWCTGCQRYVSGAELAQAGA